MADAIPGCAILLFVLFSLMTVVFMINWGFKSHERRNRLRAETLGPIARRWGGKHIPSYFAAEHKLSLLIDGIPGLVTFQAGSKNQQAWTRVHFNSPSPRRLRVAPEGFMGWLSRLVGGGDLRLGDAEFDKAFWVETSDEGWARDVLQPELRAAILRLRESNYGFGSGTVSLDAGPAGLSVRVSILLVDQPDRLERLIEVAEHALRRVHGKAAAGMVLEAVEIQIGSECPVCGHPVQGGRRCPSCGTPHHDDCWKYSAGCAIFGCAARKGAA